jgi:hypothetical protein
LRERTLFGSPVKIFPLTIGRFDRISPCMDPTPLPQVDEQPKLDALGRKMPSQAKRRERAKKAGMAASLRARAFKAAKAANVIALPPPSQDEGGQNPWAMTPEQAADCIQRELSPEQLTLWMVRRLRCLADADVGKSVDALKMLQELQRDLVPSSRKATLVSFHPTAREA